MEGLQAGCQGGSRRVQRLNIRKLRGEWRRGIGSACRVESARATWCHLRQSLYALGQLRADPGQAREKCTENVAPFSVRASTEIRPPWRSTSACEIARPRPKPGTSIEREALPR